MTKTIRIPKPADPFHKPDRTPAQSEMLSSIPPITAFMGMGG